MFDILRNESALFLESKAVAIDWLSHFLLCLSLSLSTLLHLSISCATCRTVTAHIQMKLVMEARMDIQHLLHRSRRWATIYRQIMWIVQQLMNREALPSSTLTSLVVIVSTFQFPNYILSLSCEKISKLRKRNLKKCFDLRILTVSMKKHCKNSKGTFRNLHNGWLIIAHTNLEMLSWGLFSRKIRYL